MPQFIRRLSFNGRLSSAIQEVCGSIACFCPQFFWQLAWIQHGTRALDNSSIFTLRNTILLRCEQRSNAVFYAPACYQFKDLLVVKFFSSITPQLLDNMSICLGLIQKLLQNGAYFTFLFQK